MKSKETWVVKDPQGKIVATGLSESGAWNKITWSTGRTVNQLKYLGYTSLTPSK